MVEIARAFTVTDRPARLVILDEPTSSLDAVVARPAARLRAPVLPPRVARRSSSRTSSARSCPRPTAIVVMRDGLVVADDRAAAFTRDSLVSGDGPHPRDRDRAGRRPVVDRSEPAGPRQGRPAGRRDDRPRRPRRRDRRSRRAWPARARPRCCCGSSMGRAATRGQRHGRGRGRRPADRRHLPAVVDHEEHLDRLAPRAAPSLARGRARPRPAWARPGRTGWPSRRRTWSNPILSLSGGNQQKALFARALGSEARIILMDDPMRGVDVGTKREVYRLIREEAARGRTFLWYTTETDELEHCDHVYVFREGAIVADLSARRADRGEGAARLVPGRRAEPGRCAAGPHVLGLERAAACAPCCPRSRCASSCWPSSSCAQRR